MEYNLLDRIIDEDNYGPSSAEWRLRGLSKAGQENLIHDVSRKLEKRAKNAGVNFSADEYEKKLLTMPETFQDATLYSAIKAPIKFNNRLFFDGKPSQYDSEKHRIEINSSFMNDSEKENSLFHESSHWFDHGNGRVAKVYGRIDNTPHKMRVSNLGENNVGGLLREEILDAKSMNGEPLPDYDYVGNAISDASDREYEVQKRMLDGADEGLREYMEPIINDWFKLHPSYARGNGSHGLSYKRGLQNFALMAGVRDKTAIENYPLSMESVAEIVPAFGYDGGEKMMRNYAPKVIESMDKSFSNHPGLKRFVPPSRKYADEEGLRLIQERDEKLAERRRRATERYNAKFLELPEDKRNYYESAAPGTTLWMRDPSFIDDESGGLYPIVKDDPENTFMGNKLRHRTNEYGTGCFYKNGSYDINLNHLSPEDAYRVPNEMELWLANHEKRNFDKRLEKRKKRK